MSLKIFVNKFNKSLPSIKFANEISKTGINFSEVTEFKVRNKLRTKLYIKSLHKNEVFYSGFLQ